MTELEMKNIITTALGRSCNCESGGECPDLWHTWDRLEGRGASCFCGKDSGSQRGIFKLNLESSDVHLFLKTARSFGFWANRDKDNEGLRVTVSLGKSPSPDKVNACIVWIRKAKGAFVDSGHILV